MSKDRTVLCGSNSYEQKYFFNGIFDELPQSIKEELKILCVLYTEDVGGLLSLEFEQDGSLILCALADEGDILYDDIGSVLKIKQIQEMKIELMEALELYYRTFVLKRQE